ncbi:MAG: hypothetical protein JSV80_01635, partial [Acidobacteriota bacterium]
MDSELMLVESRSGSLDGEALSRSVHVLGGRVVAHLPGFERALVRGPRGFIRRLERLLPSLRVRTQPVESSEIGLYQDESLTALQAWNVFSSAKDVAVGEPEPEDGFGQDLIIPLPWWDQPAAPMMMSSSQPSSQSSGLRPAGATWENTSEFLAGNVSINMMLLESNGAVDASTENWTQVLESQVLAEALQAISGIESMYPGTELTFTLHLLSGRTDERLQTSYEPILRPADTAGVSGEELWALEVLSQLGYGLGGRMTRSRLFADETRVADGTDWAVNVFVVNSTLDTDGRFADGYFAYTYLGGPHVVLTSDNDGWGLSRFDAVLRHELHHAFFALDEYATSSCSCSTASGYLGGSNDNCENGCGVIDACVMRNNVVDHCLATDTQVG